MKANLKTEFAIPSGVTVAIEADVIKVKGPKGEVSRKLVHPKIKLVVENGHIILSAEDGSKREKTMMGTFEAHIKNMFIGVTKGHKYHLKICSTHFPMSVAINNNKVIIKNYLGEAFPRKADIVKTATVKIEGNDIFIESLDVEAAGLMAGRIESATRITNRDRRIFQDGIFIVEKRGKKI